MSLALAALVLALLSPGPASAPPDYIGTMGNPFGGPPASIRSHEGAVRMDFPRGNGEVASEYDVSGQFPIVTTTRNPQGEVSTLGIRGRDTAPLLASAAWVDVGVQRTLAGEACRVQEMADPRGGLSLSRCVTADGVNLVPRRDGRLMEMQTLRRGPVPAAEVTPPLELIDLRRWVPAEALADKPDRAKTRDYVAAFENLGRTVSRSGAWTLEAGEASWPSRTLVNDDVGLEVRISAPNDLWIRRFAPGQRFRLAFKPDLMQGRATETLFGELCHWRSRSATPDTSDFECRTDDGAVLALGGSGVHGQSWAPATSFQRKPVPLASILPEQKYFTPAHYRLPTAAAR